MKRDALYLRPAWVAEALFAPLSLGQPTPRSTVGPRTGVRKPKKRKFKGSKAARKAGRK